MKFRTVAAFTGGAFYLVVGILLLASGSANAHNLGTKKQISIKFEVVTDKDGNQFLEVSNQDVKNCKDHDVSRKSRKNGYENDDVSTGCFRLEKNTSGLIRFQFQDSNDADYELTQFTICRVDPDQSENPQPGQKLSALCGNKLSIDERLEFSIMNKKNGEVVLPIPEDGVVNLSDPTYGLGANLKKFYLVDQNTIEQVYFYNIEACTGVELSRTCLTLDPPVENTGGNN